MPEMLKPREVCELLRINENTLARWVKEGKFPKPVQIGNVRRWPAESVRKAVTA